MSSSQEKSIFLSALERETESERKAYLAEVCGQNAALRREVEKLLDAHGRSRNVLDATPDPVKGLREKLDAAGGAVSTGALALAADAIADERTGETIGNYRLLEKIGEGGFGQVYVAEQREPVRRRVALKLLKPGMDSREVIARFEAERQALALMDHPNIASVFDAGSTAAGQPFFVMELVRGVPITTFCDHQRLTTGERIKLFIDVCQAVQHAHQKGVIHRDLKPTNVMITLHDGTPVVKVIDFGVAKAISEPLTHKTLYTRFAQMIGTPLYMSPEQAEMSGLDVDTRSDIYSLGVMLYELLTGTTPFDQKRMQTAAFDELRRIIREEEPPRPSVRLSTLAASVATISANQRTEPRALSNILRGDLDWVVMKALEKDRRRRYETAADFARDLRRYLNHEPVIARPPSPWYRFTKFARRNKVTFTTGSLVLSALLIGTVVSTWQAIRATEARAEADSLRKKAEDFADRLKKANVLLDSARANADEGRWALAYEQCTQATKLQPEHYMAWAGRGILQIRLGAWRSAAADYAEALALGGAPANNPAWWGVPALCVYGDQLEAYDRACDTLNDLVEDSQDPAAVMFAIRGLSLMAHPDVDRTTLAERMERLLAEERKQREERRPGPEAGKRQRMPFDRPGKGMYGFGNMPDGLLAYAAGLAQLRAGNGAKAIEHFNVAVQSAELGDRDDEDEKRSEPRERFKRGWTAGKMAYAGLALAHFEAGNRPEAEQALVEAEKTLKDWTARLMESTPFDLSFPWFDYVECLILYREAHGRIKGSAPPADDRLERLEQQALALLRGRE